MRERVVVPVDGEPPGSTQAAGNVEPAENTRGWASHGGCLTLSFRDENRPYNRRRSSTLSAGPNTSAPRCSSVQRAEAREHGTRSGSPRRAQSTTRVRPRGPSSATPKNAGWPCASPNDGHQFCQNHAQKQTEGRRGRQSRWRAHQSRLGNGKRKGWGSAAAAGLKMDALLEAAKKKAVRPSSTTQHRE